MKQKDNKALVAVGIIAAFNLLALLVPLSMFTVNALIIGKIEHWGLNGVNSIELYYIPHIAVVFISLITSLILCIGGLTRKNGLCAAALFANGIVMILSRLFNNLFDMMACASIVRLEKNLIDALFKMLNILSFRQMFRGSAAVSAIFIFLALILAVVLLIMKATNNNGVLAKVMAIILTVLAVSTVLIAGLADIISLNISNIMYQQSHFAGSAPYIAVVFDAIKVQFARGLFSGAVPNKLILMEPLGFIVKDIFLMVLIPLITISSTVTISAKKNTKEVW